MYGVDANSLPNKGFFGSITSNGVNELIGNGTGSELILGFGNSQLSFVFAGPCVGGLYWRRYNSSTSSWTTWTLV